MRHPAEEEGSCRREARATKDAESRGLNHGGFAIEPDASQQVKVPTGAVVWLMANGAAIGY